MNLSNRQRDNDLHRVVLTFATLALYVWSAINVSDIQVYEFNSNMIDTHKLSGLMFQKFRRFKAIKISSTFVQIMLIWNLVSVQTKV